MKKDKLIALLAALCLLSVAVMVLALNRGLQNRFVPPPFEPAACTGMPEVPAGLGYQQLDVQVYQVGICGEIDVQDGAARVWFTNPKENSVWLRLRILDERGSILGQTGLLRPGEYVRQIPIVEVQPRTPITMKVMAYEPETYHSAGALVLHTAITAE